MNQLPRRANQKARVAKERVIAARRAKIWVIIGSIVPADISLVTYLASDMTQKSYQKKGKNMIFKVKTKIIIGQVPP